MSGARAYGFKLIFTPERWDPQRFGTGDAMLGRLLKHGFAIITVRRRSLLAQAVSLVIAERFGYHVRRPLLLLGSL